MHQKKELGNNSQLLHFYEYWFRKRARKGSLEVHFTNNARMVYDHPVLICSSDSGLNAFFPTLLLDEFRKPDFL